MKASEEENITEFTSIQTFLSNPGASWSSHLPKKVNFDGCKVVKISLIGKRRLIAVAFLSIYICLNEETELCALFGTSDSYKQSNHSAYIWKASTSKTQYHTSMTQNVWCNGWNRWSTTNHCSLLSTHLFILKVWWHAR